jgi:hypothetical protein
MTCLDIITEALREIRVVGVSRQPKASEAELGLHRLQAILTGLFGFGVGKSLTDQVVESDTDLNPDTRALVYASTPITFTFPEMPSDGQRIQIQDLRGNFASYPVTIEATPANIILNTSGAIYTFVYVTDTATWVAVSPITLSGQLALGDDEFFTLELANRLAPVFGAQLSPESASALQRAGNRIRARFSYPVVTPCDDAVLFLGRQSYTTGFGQ